VGDPEVVEVDQREVQRRGGPCARYPSSYVVASIRQGAGDTGEAPEGRLELR